MVRFFFVVPVFNNLNLLHTLQASKLCHDYTLTFLCIAVIDLSVSPGKDNNLNLLHTLQAHNLCHDYELIITLLYIAVIDLSNSPDKDKNQPPIPTATYIPAAVRVSPEEEPRINLLRRIHSHEFLSGMVLDPSWCQCPTCEYSAGDLHAQRYTLMKRLYQVNNCLYGSVNKKYITDDELMRQLI